VPPGSGKPANGTVRRFLKLAETAMRDAGVIEDNSGVIVVTDLPHELKRLAVILDCFS
jgi:hypothetical protein